MINLKEQRLKEIDKYWFANTKSYHFAPNTSIIPEDIFENLKQILSEHLKKKNVKWKGKTGDKYDYMLRTLMYNISNVYKHEILLEISQKMWSLRPISNTDNTLEYKMVKRPNWSIIKNLLDAMEELELILIKPGNFSFVNGKKITNCTKILPFVDPQNFIFMHNFPHPKPIAVKTIKTYDKKEFLYNKQSKELVKHKVNLKYNELKNEGKDADILLAYNDFAEDFEVMVNLKKGEHKLFSHLEGDINLCPYLVRKFSFKGKITPLSTLNISQVNNYGRLYCHNSIAYQQLRGKSRKNITINGNKTVEMDYSGQSINMLYALEDIQYVGDAYELYPELKNTMSSDDYMLLRSVFKDAGIPIVGTKSFEECQKTVEYQIQKRFKKNSEEFERFKALIPAYGFMDTNTSSLTVIARDILNRFINKHAQIKHLFFCDKAKEMQYLDSSIALSVINQMMNVHGSLALCIHDSFIVEERYKEELVEVMKNTYRTLLKKEIEVK